MKPLPHSFYLRHDVVLIARELIGKVLETTIDGKRSSGIIAETEAYAGHGDKASHAYGGRRTPRNEPMYGQGGTAYVYLCYGMHRLFNVVTNEIGIPHAVLIRAILPFRGIPLMESRRMMESMHPRFSSGPGTLTQALGIGMQHNMHSLQSASLRICEGYIEPADHEINVTARIGIDYAGADASLPYRFVLKKSALDRIREKVHGLKGIR